VTLTPRGVLALQAAREVLAALQAEEGATAAVTAIKKEGAE